MNWISVEERLPDREMYCYVWRESEKGEYRFVKGPCFRIASWHPPSGSDPGFWAAADGEAKDVTHWQRLPLPPDSDEPEPAPEKIHGGDLRYWYEAWQKESDRHFKVRQTLRYKMEVARQSRAALSVANHLRDEAKAELASVRRVVGVADNEPIVEAVKGALEGVSRRYDKRIEELQDENERLKQKLSKTCQWLKSSDDEVDRLRTERDNWRARFADAIAERDDKRPARQPRR